ncbi:response regulator [Stutzerimonas kirkiae]|uniref:DNA-binding response regulator n=1 Tax=Stutzerimonas kirkiae TaxID=2211392 RepID=A0A4Q9R608_9GAMM|nr:response regulator transcription factor [Stutzerimonas kirkiae]TBU95983.1 DNA-binding response regulator [Stutzerimonas kirkiae]TBV03186.1 DNA-binding response regulator [Stutzerimonas kirkiae]TBV09731.1 DNA-binding response regulator [Stutzerimonas kirkiae]
MKTTPILLIDDHALFRSGIAMVLQASLECVEIFQAGSLEQALRLADIEPCLVLLDVQLQGVSGLEGIESLRRKWPVAKVVMVSAFDLSEVVSEAVERGALAFISKTERPERMLQQIRELLADDGAPAPRSVAISPRPRLTPRQCEVLDLLCQGLSNKMIGRRLNLSEHTVRGHVQAMLAALQVSSRSEAVFAARRLGLIR